MADEKWVDISQYIESADFTLVNEPDDATIPGIKPIGPITITGTWGHWMHTCGICGEKFKVASTQPIARVTCEELNHSVLACTQCAESFLR